MHTFMEVLTSMIHHLRYLWQKYLIIQNIPHKKLGSPWRIWMVHWTIIGTLSLCQILCTINQLHAICWHSQFVSYPDSFPVCHTRGLSQSAISRHYFHPSKNTVGCTTTLIWWHNQTFTCKNIRTPCNSHQKNTITLPIVTPTPIVSHIFLRVQSKRVPVLPESTPDPSQKVLVLHPTPTHRVHKKFSTHKPL